MQNLKSYVIDQYAEKDYPQINFISPNGISINETTGFLEGNVTEIAQDILNEYDFIGVSKQFDGMRMISELHASLIFY